MRKLIFTLLAMITLSLLMSCGGASQKDLQAEKELQTMDSISAEMEQTIQNLEEQTEELEKEVDDILNDLE